MKKVKIKGREAIGTSQGLTKSFRALLYADDTLLCEDSEGAMQALLWAVEDVSGVFDLTLNRRSTALPGKSKAISAEKNSESQLHKTQAMAILENQPSAKEDLDVRSHSNFKAAVRTRCNTANRK